MNNLKIYPFVFLFLLAFSFSIKSQINGFQFRKISPPGGFSLKAIYSITQDELGYIWLGTRQGLIRYSSNETKWFIPSEADSSSLPGVIINNIRSDASNVLWIATNGGLCTFNHKDQKFRTIAYTYEDRSARAPIVRSSHRIDDNSILILDELYVGILYLETNIMHRLGLLKEIQPTKVYRDNYNRFWIGTATGDIYQFSLNDYSLKKTITGKGESINTIYADIDQLWIGYRSGGAKRFNLNGKQTKEYAFNSSYDNNPSSGNVRVIKKDTYGRIWFGAYEGLFMDDGKELHQFKPDDYPGLPHNSIYELFEDRQGGFWIGTWSGGVALIHHSDNQFQSYRHNAENNSISNNMVSSFLKVASDQLLIGTEVGGLNRMNLTTEQFEKIKINKNDGIKNIKTICKDKEGTIWIGTFREGLWYQAQNSQHFSPFSKTTKEGLNLTKSSVYSMCAVDSGLWIGTFSSGIYFYEYGADQLRYCFHYADHNNPTSSSSVQCILADAHRNLWIGTQFGLFRKNLKTGKIEEIKHTNLSLSFGNNSIYCMWERKTDEIWFGVKNNGILIYNTKNDQFKTFYADGLLKDKDVYGLAEDNENNIWITSNNGLIVHDPHNQSNRHFVYSDGIQSNLFCPQAIYKDDTGIIYFGGTNGFTKIKPSTLKVNSKKPFTIISKLETKNNRTIYPSYSKKLEVADITLSPKENTFRISFTCDNYLMPEKNKYQYRLINYYNEWIDAEASESVLFTSINSGEYFFEVRSCNNDGVWSAEPTRVRIKINSFWYRTPMAFGFYLALFLITIFFIRRFYIEQLKLKKKILVEKNQRENEEQIHEMKLKFFTNISHEFRTPLTLISWPLQRLLQAENITKEQRNELEVVNQNSSRLLQLINQLIDLRKLEKSKNELDLSTFDLIPLISDMKKGFNLEAKRKDIKFEFESPFSSFIIEADKEKLDLVLYNLVSNAYKYTSKQGTIKVTVDGKINTYSKTFTNQLSFGEIACDDLIEITVEDTGTGIASEDLLKIFNRFEQGKQSANPSNQKIKGSGIGLSICKDYTLLHNGVITAQSNIGKGSRFTLLLPRKQKAQNILYESHQEFKNLKSSETIPVPFKKDKEPDQLIQILVVEDNKDFNSFICSFLNQFYQIESAMNGEEALIKLRKRNFDLVVSDVMMPEMDGYELCNHIKSKVETSHIPVILLTALSSSENIITGLDKGADAYLTKPFNENVLLKQIENTLKQRQRIRDNFAKQFVSKKPIETGSLDNFFLNRVRMVVEKNISDENFNMESLADELMISRSQLHRKIKSLSGTTTSEFVNLVRIKKAVELLENNNYTYSEVAFMVGFSSQSYFTKCFKKVYETTPKEYFMGRK